LNVKTQDAPVLSASAAGKEEKEKKGRRDLLTGRFCLLFIGVVSCVEVYLLEGVCKFRK